MPPARFLWVTAIFAVGAEAAGEVGADGELDPGIGVAFFLFVAGGG